MNNTFYKTPGKTDVPGRMPLEEPASEVDCAGLLSALKNGKSERISRRGEIVGEIVLGRLSRTSQFIFALLLTLCAMTAFCQSASTNSAVLNQTNFAVTLTQKSMYEIDSGALYNPSLKSGKFGAFLGLDSAIGSGLGLGFAGGYLNDRPLYGSVSLKLGAKTAFPYIGTWSYFASSGPDYDFKVKTVGSYNFVGLSKIFYLNKRETSELCLGWSIGDISQIAGLTQIGSLSFVKHF